MEHMFAILFPGSAIRQKQIVTRKNLDYSVAALPR